MNKIPVPPDADVLVIGDAVYRSIGKCVCGVRVFANDELGSIAHVEPRCEEFDRLDPLAFITWLRLSLGIIDEDEKVLN